MRLFFIRPSPALAAPAIAGPAASQDEARPPACGIGAACTAGAPGAHQRAGREVGFNSPTQSNDRIVAALRLKIDLSPGDGQ